MVFSIEEFNQEMRAERERQCRLYHEYVAERMRKADEVEKKRKAEEAEQKRKVEEAERKRQAEETWRKRQAEEGERKRQAEERERKRKTEEAGKPYKETEPNGSRVVQAHENLKRSREDYDYGPDKRRSCGTEKTVDRVIGNTGEERPVKVKEPTVANGREDQATDVAKRREEAATPGNDRIVGGTDVIKDPMEKRTSIEDDGIEKGASSVTNHRGGKNDSGKNLATKGSHHPAQPPLNRKSATNAAPSRSSLTLIDVQDEHRWDLSKAQQNSSIPRGMLTDSSNHQLQAAHAFLIDNDKYGALAKSPCSSCARQKLKCRAYRHDLILSKVPGCGVKCSNCRRLRNECDLPYRVLPPRPNPFGVPRKNGTLPKWERGEREMSKDGHQDTRRQQ